jgi:NhaP-type Na+/H+ or K+/H+ antiporter
VLGVLALPLESVGVQLLLTLGVSAILFHGGLGLLLSVLRPVAFGLGLLAIPGAVVTALVTGAVAALAFDVPLEVGLLIGAVLAPTDPAILIPLLDRLRIRAKVKQTIEALPALVTLAGLILLARPLTVVLCLLPDRRGSWRREELAFLAWTRETGVVPAALVGVLVGEGVRQESELLTVVALAVVVTLLVQATTKAGLARRLGLEKPEPEEPDRRAAHSA